MSNRRFDVDWRTKTDFNIKLLYVTSSKYEGDWHSTRHIHYFTELFYVLDGRGRFLVEDSNFEVMQDDMVIVNPNVEHTEVSLNASPLEYIVLGVEGLSFSFGEKEEPGSYSVCNYGNHREELLFYFHSLLAESANKEANYEIVCQNLLEVLILKLIRHTKDSMTIAPNQRITKECGLMKRFLDSNYTQNITLDTLAEMTHMNKFYLVHAFSKYTGMSPINYLIARRIEESKNLLRTTNYSISQIAEIIGFSSQSYFSQCFRKATGGTPNEYRKREKTEQAESPLGAAGKKGR